MDVVFSLVFMINYIILVIGGNEMVIYVLFVGYYFEDGMLEF